MKNKFFSQYILLLFLALPMFERSLHTDEHREEVLAKPQFKRILTVEEVLTVQPKLRPRYTTVKDELEQAPEVLLNNCFVSYNHDGIPFQFSQVLEDSACSIKTAFPTNIQNEFGVFELAAAPIMAYSTQDAAVEACYDYFLNKPVGKSFYLKIATIKNETGNLNFKLDIKLPDTLNSIVIDATASNLIRERLNKVFDNELKIGAANSYDAHDNAFIEVMSALKELLLNLDQLSSLTEEMLIADGFEQVELDEGFTMAKFKRSGTQTLTGNVIDYAGMDFDQNSTTLVSYIQQAIASAQFSTAFILTDNGNYSKSLSCDYNKAKLKLKEEAPKVIIWMHFFQKADKYTLFCKGNSNLSEAEAEDYLKSIYDTNAVAPEPPDDPLHTLVGDNERSSADCTYEKWRTNCGTNNMYNRYQGQEKMVFGITCGFIDGFMDTVEFIYNTGSGLKDGLKNAISLDFWTKTIRKVTDIETWKKVAVDSWSLIKEGWQLAKTFIKAIEAFVSDPMPIVRQLKDGIGKMIQGEIQNGGKKLGYFAGKQLYDLAESYLTGGFVKATKAAKIYQKGAASGSKIKEFLDAIVNKKVESFVNKIAAAGDKTKLVLCKIGIGGCFVAGTPVWAVANSNLVNIPVEQLTIFQHVVANTVVNSNGSLSADMHDFGGKLSDHPDPFVSSQQKERDQFSINDVHNWFEVSFEQVNGTSACILGLHKDWLENRGDYKVGSVIQMAMPEQGISGPFTVKSIKHALPQKIPTQEDTENYMVGNFAVRPITGIFVHQSDQVLQLKFENGDSIGVTKNHPIYSNSSQKWQLASDLMTGEEVLTYHGSSKLNSKVLLTGVHQVYNLEVKDLHNFLVGDNGVVVYNTCLAKFIREVLENTALRIKKINGKLVIPNDWVKKDVLRNGKIVGSRYVHPTNPKIQIRLHDKGDLPHRPHNYDKPYARYELGKDANGIDRHADIDGNMVDLNDPKYYEKTHFLIEGLDVE